MTEDLYGYVIDITITNNILFKECDKKIYGLCFGVGRNVKWITDLEVVA